MSLCAGMRAVYQHLAMRVVTHLCWFHWILFSWKELQAAARKLHISSGKRKQTEKAAFLTSFQEWSSENCFFLWGSENCFFFLDGNHHLLTIYLEEKRVNKQRKLSPELCCWIKQHMGRSRMPLKGQAQSICCLPIHHPAGPWKEASTSSCFSA